MAAWVYLKSKYPEQLWTVGFYSPDGIWNPDSDHESQEEATKRVNYLNGGNE